MDATWTEALAAESAANTQTEQPSVFEEPATQWAIQYTMLTLCAVTIFVNPLTLTVMVKGKLVMKSSINVCITSLCCSDLLFGVAVFFLHLPIFSPQLVAAHIGLRKVRFAATVCSLPAFIMSNINCLLVTLDRAIATLSPHKYKAKMTAKKTRTVLAAIWIITVIFSLLMSAVRVLMDGEYGVLDYLVQVIPISVTYVASPCIILGLLTNVVLYVIIVRSLAKSGHRVRLQTTSRYEKRTNRMTRMVAIVIGVMLIGNLPIVITAAIPCHLHCSPSYMPLYRLAYDVNMCIAVVPTFVNNVIYFGRMADFKKCLSTLFHSQRASSAKQSNTIKSARKSSSYPNSNTSPTSPSV